jgi:uncharacterized repeat protein (TIGR03833 family)
MPGDLQESAFSLTTSTEPPLHKMANKVPRIDQVTPGAGVSIVLKADQRTGREVQGAVQDVLTSGNHPRGIKVRLTDGRIGRVQRMVDPSTLASHASTQDGPVIEEGGENDKHARPFVQRSRYRDVRQDEPLERPAEQVGLDAYIVAPKKKGKGRKNAQQATQSKGDGVPMSQDEPDADVKQTATVTCPVCSMEGDETAIAHHVSSHFD